MQDFDVCNQLNLVTTTRLREEILNVNGRSHVLRHVVQRIVELWKGAQLREVC